MSKYKNIIIKENVKLYKFLEFNYPNFNNILFLKSIRNKDIIVNNSKVTTKYTLKKGDNLLLSEFIIKILNNKKEIITKKTKVTEKEIEKFKSYIIYDDENIFAINKPNELAVQGGNKIKKCVADYLKKEERLVHRLDKDTSGVLVIAKNRENAEILTEYFKNKDDNLEKIYLAVVVGKLNKNEDIISMPLIKKIENKIEKVYVDKKNGKEAITHYRLLKYNEYYNLSYLEIKILTGRTHQIRVHLKEIGRPILGDGKYGGNMAYNKDFNSKMHLHSYILNIKNFHNKNINIKAGLPSFFRDTLNKINR
ncbi:MAG: RluA family pseudouridine synthase [Rickettsiales bacterium]|jgi:23S rRNA pseudouridine955/2504/2580 synthase|nr:RluA family pseudouridine synthase [Rickettsiales bacterium]